MPGEARGRPGPRRLRPCRRNAEVCRPRGRERRGPPGPASLRGVPSLRALSQHPPRPWRLSSAFRPMDNDTAQTHPAPLIAPAGCGPRCAVRGNLTSSPLWTWSLFVLLLWARRVLVLGSACGAPFTPSGGASLKRVAVHHHSWRTGRVVQGSRSLVPFTLGP